MKIDKQAWYNVKLSGGIPQIGANISGEQLVDLNTRMKLHPRQRGIFEIEIELEGTVAILCVDLGQVTTYMVQVVSDIIRPPTNRIIQPGPN